jgi:hypothetical protein
VRSVPFFDWILMIILFRALELGNRSGLLGNTILSVQLSILYIAYGIPVSNCICKLTYYVIGFSSSIYTACSRPAPVPSTWTLATAGDA